MPSESQPTAGERMTLVAEASGLPQAELLRSMLEAAGVRVELLAAGAGVAYGFTVGALARVQLFVECSHVQEALRLLTQIREDNLTSSAEQKYNTFSKHP